jgi:hypothetical protein
VLESNNLKNLVTYEEELPPIILTLIGEIGGAIFVLYFMFSIIGNFLARRSVISKIASDLYFQKNDKKTTKIHDTGNLLGIVLQPFSPGIF